MTLKTILMAGALSLAGAAASASCAFENTVPLKSLTAGFEAWKAATDAMAECGNFSASLDQEFKEKLEVLKEDRKDDRVKKESAEQSKLISQRQGKRGEVSEPIEDSDRSQDIDEIIGM